MNYASYLDKRIPSLKGKNIVITGANSGIGFSCANQCAYKGANVYLACRSKSRAEKAIENIRQETKNSHLKFLEYDQADFSSIKKFAKELNSLNILIDVLVLNAGIYRPGKNLKTKDGFPLTTGTNFLGEFVLLNELSKMIEKRKILKIIFVSSFGRLFASENYMDYLYEDNNKLSRAYFASKKMNFKYAGNLKAKYPYLDVSIMHPGIATTRIVNTELHKFPKWLVNLGNFIFKIFANTSDKSSLCFLRDISSPNLKGINFYFPRGLFHIMGYPAKKKLNEEKIKSDLLETTCYNLVNTI